jgi:hypothetical protein
VATNNPYGLKKHSIDPPALDRSRRGCPIAARFRHESVDAVGVACAIDVALGRSRGRVPRSRATFAGNRDDSELLTPTHTGSGAKLVAA